jgi:hypothetical protein
MSNKQNTPFIDVQTLASAVTGSGAFTYDMRGIDRASLQLNATLSSSNTDVVTLKISNDGINFVTFSTSKTVTFANGTLNNALFELGPIDYVFLQVSYAAPSAGSMTLVGYLYGVSTQVQNG